jgi:hypothetical protein
VRKLVTPRRQNIAIAIIVFIASLTVYRSNDGNAYTFDSAPASLFALNALERHTFSFDDFRTSYLNTGGARYIFTEAPNGHLEPIFPIGTALLATPYYVWHFVIAAGRGPLPDITAVTFESMRLTQEKEAASLIAALAAALFFLCATRLSRWPGALLATVAFTFGSDMWTVASQALWQHGSVALVTLAMILPLLSRPPHELRGRMLLLAGLCAGYLPVIRPTALVYSLAGIAFVSWFAPKKFAIFGAGIIAGILPGVIWNVAVFHSLIGGYAVNDQSYAFSFQQFFEGASGLLVSPSRGIFVFTPFVLFSIAGAVVAWRQRSSQARLMQLLSLASLATFANYAFFTRWQGGSTFGPRYLTDLIPTAALLLAYVIPSDIRTATVARRLSTAVLALAIAASVGVQFVGANGEPKTNWSGVPLDLTAAPERVWAWRDSQIERDTRATIDLQRANPTFPNSYAAGFDGRIESLNLPSSGDAGAVVPIEAMLLNTGRSPWYDYKSGLFFGQLHLRIRFFDASGALALERFVYIVNSPRSGEATSTIGTIDLPQSPGTYRIMCDIDVFQDARIGSRHVGVRSLIMTIR